jgi:hypothetical protein
MKGGRFSIACASSALRLASAPVVSFRLPTSPARSSRRSASAVTSRELSTRKRSSTGVSRVSSLKRRRDVDSAGLRYSKPLAAWLPRPDHWRAEPLKKSWSDLRVSGSSVLKSWSRSTAVLVRSVPIWPPSSISEVCSPSGKRRST